MRNIALKIVSALLIAIIAISLFSNSSKPPIFIQTTVVAASLATVSLVPLSLEEANIPTAKITNTFFWKFDGILWRWELRVPESLYYYFKTIPRSPERDCSVYLINPIDDSCLDKMAKELHRIAAVRGYDEKKTVEFASSFVQNIGYSSDNSTTGLEDYPRYPLETLADKTGDCEDTSILLTALLNSMGYNAALMYFSETSSDVPHYGIGIAAVKGTFGTNWIHNNIRYYYLETTSLRWPIGAIPGGLTICDPEVHLPSPSPFIQYSWGKVNDGDSVTINIELANIGQADAQNINISIYYVDTNESTSNCLHSELLNTNGLPIILSAGESVNYELPSSVIQDKDYVLYIHITYSGDGVGTYRGG